MHAQTYTDDRSIGSQLRSVWGWGDGAMEFSRTTCFMHANPKPGNGAENEAFWAMHMLLSREQTEDRKAAFLPPPFG